MKYIVIVFLSVLLFGCHGGPGDPTNLTPSQGFVADARANNSKAKVNAQQIDKEGSAPGAPVVKELEANIGATDASLVKATDSLTAAQEDANAKAAEHVKQVAALNAKNASHTKHWTYFSIIAIVFTVLLAIFAPLIIGLFGAAASQGVTAIISKIPIVGGFVNYAEEVAGAIAGLLISLSVMGIGILFGIL